MDIKTRIDALTEAEAKAALDWAIQRVSVYGMTERDEMRALAAAHRCGECEVVRPVPCVRDENGETKRQTVKELFAKIDEELDELKATVLSAFYSLDVVPADRPDLKNVNKDDLPYIAEEAADTITAITTLCEALGIDRAARNEAQRMVNERNRKRGRL